MWNLRDVVEVDAVLLEAEEVAGPAISALPRSATNFNFSYEGRQFFPAGNVSLTISRADPPYY